MPVPPFYLHCTTNALRAVQVKLILPVKFRDERQAVLILYYPAIVKIIVPLTIDCFVIHSNIATLH